MMEKVSAAQIDAVMLKAAAALRSVEIENVDLKQKLAHYKRRDHAEKIASQAVDRGIMESDDVDDYVSQLTDGDQDLKMVEDFISRAAAGLPLGKEKVASDNEVGDSETDVLTTFLLTSDVAG